MGYVALQEYTKESVDENGNNGGRDATAIASTEEIKYVSTAPNVYRLVD